MFSPSAASLDNEISAASRKGSPSSRPNLSSTAAMEANWSTNPPGTGASFAVLALPDKEREENKWSLEVPNLLSFLSFHTLKGRVPGLREFPPQDRPPVWLPFYAFRIMVLIGFVMLFMTLWALGKWLRSLLVPVILIYNMYMHGVFKGKVRE